MKMSCKTYGPVRAYTEELSGFCNNVTVIEGEKRLILIDTFKERELMEDLLKLLWQDFKKPVQSIVLSHWHIDHSLGASYIPDAELIASSATVLMIESFIEQDQERLKGKGIIPEHMGLRVPDRSFDSRLEIEISGRTLELRRVPGHTHDSVIILYDNIMIAGDTLLGEEVELFLPPLIPPDAPFSKAEDLPRALKTIQEIDSIDHIIPGHGSPGERDFLLKSNWKRLNKQSKT